MGQGGLRTDDAPTVLKPTDLIVANNVNFHSNLIEKDSGSTRFNLTAIPSGALAAYDWWPTASITDRKLVVVGGDGKVYAINNAGTVTEITGGTNPLSITNQFFFIAAGREATTANRKLFIMNGIDPIQVISGTAGTKANLSSPNADWGASNQPRAAFSHRGAIFVFGVPSAPHTVYRSSFTNHEDFSTASPTTVRYSVYQGEGEVLMAAMVFRGKPFVYKSPAGLYALDDSATDPTTWFFVKTSGILGAASPNSVVEALNDVIAKTPTDALLSVAATQQFGDVTASNVLEIQNIAQFIRENTTPDGAPQTWGVYYSEKRTLYFNYRSTQGTSPDRLLGVRMETNGAPKATWITKDAPHCLALRKDTQLIPRPIYGSLDGYVYLMDQTSRNVNNVAYIGEFRTPDMDFGFYDARVAGQLEAKNKIYDFLELRYLPQGDYPSTSMSTWIRSTRRL
jgi:hypothetical protein